MICCDGCDDCDQCERAGVCRLLLTLTDDFDADELGLDPEEPFDA